MLIVRTPSFISDSKVNVFMQGGIANGNLLQQQVQQVQPPPPPPLTGNSINGHSYFASPPTTGPVQENGIGMAGSNYSGLRNNRLDSKL